MQRRKFLQQSSAVAAGSLVLNGIPVKGMANSPLSPSFTCLEIRERIFVMVNLFGANDTLNTVVPIQQYGLYANFRQNIKIAEVGQPNGAINLDTTLPSNQHTALHPIMTPFKQLYDAGKLNVVHGVGYANSNRSHFKSDDLWNTGGDSTAANFNFDSGWAGQMFEYRYPGLLGNPTPQMPDPPCIELGATNGSILFQTSTNNNASVLLTSNNASTFYNTLIAVGGPAPAGFPTSDYGNDWRYIDEVQRLSNAYAQRIQTVFNAGSNTSGVTYPNTAIANQLKTVARLIKGGSKTSMYTVHQYGFDTHGTQVTAGTGNSHLGAHANLLRDLTMAIKAFQDDITALGFEDRVITATHSEFGRTIDENAGLGTDHGGVSTMFIIGKGVQPGVTGVPIRLDPQYVDNRGLTDLQYDYRKVFAAILQDFMGHGSQPMLAARMLTQTNDKAPIIAATHVAPPSCYINQIIVPITLVSFTATLQSNGNALVNWETTNESNSKEFEIQHSIDGITWKKIGVVSGSNNSNSLKRYSLIHAKPSIGRNFYRMWQFDFNGGRKLYGPVNLFVKESAGFVMKSYPNPASFDFNLTITADKKQQGVLQFFDVQGHLLQQQQIQIASGFNKYNFGVQQFKGYSGELIIYIKTDYHIQRTIRQIIAK
jgi:uncharacterized protein (DUF1501 family)